jgi:hypothetical protein
MVAHVHNWNAELGKKRRKRNLICEASRGLLLVSVDVQQSQAYTFT